MFGVERAWRFRLWSMALSIGILVTTSPPTAPCCTLHRVLSIRSSVRTVQDDDPDANAMRCRCQSQIYYPTHLTVAHGQAVCAHLDAIPPADMSQSSHHYQSRWPAILLGAMISLLQLLNLIVVLRHYHQYQLKPSLCRLPLYTSSCHH